MKRPAALALLAGFFATVLFGQDRSGETSAGFFRPGDVVALVGGEEIVVMRDEPSLELQILRQPGLSGVAFRNLAFEGDTVFEQFRDLNFPSWEDQLKSIGATVVVAQFGKMESLAGPDGVSAFAAAYERLLDRLATGPRRFLLLGAPPARNAPPESVAPYNEAARELARRRGWAFLGSAKPPWSKASMRALGLAPVAPAGPELTDLVRRKNWLWFHYWRPQNWAFLHGDRTEQQSSRDHRDPTIRWFPEEMKQWLPLVAAKEKEIQSTLASEPKP
ncbi:MAG: hypothetical protein ACKV19_14970 [Verrucomicrobiales bacterium]